MIICAVLISYCTVARTVENRKLCPGPRSGSGAVLGEAHSDYYSWSRVAALGAVSAAKRPKRLRVKTLSIHHPPSTIHLIKIFGVQKRPVTARVFETQIS